jgi:N-acetylglutamate synthase-like GNAT family acetyltransferase
MGHPMTAMAPSAVVNIGHNVINSHRCMRCASVDLRVERATEEDRDAMTNVLTACGLSSFGILNPGTLYWVCRTGKGLVGICGLELGDRCALLRSVCVLESERGRGIAERLVGCALGEATRLDLQLIYLFSKDTGRYFERLGWREVPVAEVAARLPQAPQVRRYEEIGWYPDERAFVRRAAL